MTTEPPTVSECHANAARILQHAEMETDRQLMGQLDDIARTWIMLGSEVRESLETV